MCLQEKAGKGKLGGFGFRVRMGEYEIELCGTREEVTKTIEELPDLVANVHKAFDGVKPKTVTTLTVKAESGKKELSTQSYPRIQPCESCDEAVSRLLETDWGKWRPRTLDELKAALDANGVRFAGRFLAGVLMELVKKGHIRRWNTDAGFVYILVGKEAVAPRGGDAR